MTSTFAAMRGKMGSTTYYTVLMTVADLVRNVHMPTDVKGWENLSIEEKWQREPDEKRVKADIAPYFVADENRFTGSLIVGAMNVTENDLKQCYRTVSEVTKEMDKSYTIEARDVGFLKLPGNEVLVALDGQHRLRALKYAIEGIKAKGGGIELHPNHEIAGETVVVIIVPWHSKKARMIFNKVNQYAKKTSAADNIITDEDEVAHVLTRQMTIEGYNVISGDLVEMRSDNLGKGATEFTTLKTLNTINEWVLEHRHEDFSRGAKRGPKISRMPKDDNRVEAYWTLIKDFWETVLKQIDIFSEAIEHKADAKGREKREKIRNKYILGRPVGQQSLAYAFLTLTDNNKMTGEKACKNLNKVNWAIDHENWRGVLVDERGKMTAGIAKAKLAGRLAAYLAGDKTDRTKLHKDIAGDREDYKLPKPVV